MKEIELNERELQKYNVIKQLVETNGDKNVAAKQLNVSLRHINRLITKYNTEGIEGFNHGNKGKAPKNTKDQETRDLILSLYENKYKNISFQSFQHLLKKNENITLSYSFIYNLLTNNSYKSPKKHKTVNRKYKKNKTNK